MPRLGAYTLPLNLRSSRARDFARCVDIHRKPGYDPVELFTDPKLSPLALKSKIGWRLLQKKLGFRMLMDVIPLDASLVKGSHGRPADDTDDSPVFVTTEHRLMEAHRSVAATQVRDLILAHVFS